MIVAFFLTQIALICMADADVREAFKKLAAIKAASVVIEDLKEKQLSAIIENSAKTISNNISAHQIFAESEERIKAEIDRTMNSVFNKELESVYLSLGGDKSGFKTKEEYLNNVKGFFKKQINQNISQFFQNKFPAIYKQARNAAVEQQHFQLILTTYPKQKEAEMLDISDWNPDKLKSMKEELIQKMYGAEDILLEENEKRVKESADKIIKDIKQQYERQKDAIKGSLSTEAITAEDVEEELNIKVQNIINEMEKNKNKGQIIYSALPSIKKKIASKAENIESERFKEFVEQYKNFPIDRQKLEGIINSNLKAHRNLEGSLKLSTNELLPSAITIVVDKYSSPVKGTKQYADFKKRLHKISNNKDILLSIKKDLSKSIGKPHSEVRASIADKQIKKFFTSIHSGAYIVPEDILSKSLNIDSEFDNFEQVIKLTDFSQKTYDRQILLAETEKALVSKTKEILREGKRAWDGQMNMVGSFNDTIKSEITGNNFGNKKQKVWVKYFRDKLQNQWNNKGHDDIWAYNQKRPPNSDTKYQPLFEESEERNEVYALKEIEYERDKERQRLRQEAFKKALASINTFKDKKIPNIIEDAKKYILSDILKHQKRNQSYGVVKKYLVDKLNNILDIELTSIYEGYGIDKLGIDLTEYKEAVLKKYQHQLDNNITVFVENKYPDIFEQARKGAVDTQLARLRSLNYPTQKEVQNLYSEDWSGKAVWDKSAIDVIKKKLVKGMRGTEKILFDENVKKLSILADASIDDAKNQFTKQLKAIKGDVSKRAITFKMIKTEFVKRVNDVITRLELNKGKGQKIYKKFPYIEKEIEKKSKKIESERFSDFAKKYKDFNIKKEVLKKEIQADLKRHHSSYDSKTYFQDKFLPSFSAELIERYSAPIKKSKKFKTFKQHLAKLTKDDPNIKSSIESNLKNTLEKPLKEVREEIANNQLKHYFPTVNTGEFTVEEKILKKYNQNRYFYVGIDSLDKLLKIPDIASNRYKSNITILLKETENNFKSKAKSLLEEGKSAWDGQINVVDSFKKEIQDEIEKDYSLRDEEGWFKQYKRKVEDKWSSERVNKLWREDDKSPPNSKDKYLALFKKTEEQLSDLIRNEFKTIEKKQKDDKETQQKMAAQNTFGQGQRGGGGKERKGPSGKEGTGTGGGIGDGTGDGIGSGSGSGSGGGGGGAGGGGKKRPTGSCPCICTTYFKVKEINKAVEAFSMLVNMEPTQKFKETAIFEYAFGRVIFKKDADACNMQVKFSVDKNNIADSYSSYPIRVKGYPIHINVKKIKQLDEERCREYYVHILQRESNDSAYYYQRTAKFNSNNIATEQVWLGREGNMDLGKYFIIYAVINKKQSYEAEKNEEGVRTFSSLPGDTIAFLCVKLAQRR